VDIWRGALEPNACKALLVADQAGERGKACLSIETYRVRGRKAVGRPSAHMSPEDRHWAHDGGGGCHTVEPYSRMGASRGCVRVRQRWGSPVGHRLKLGRRYMGNPGRRGGRCGPLRRN